MSWKHWLLRLVVVISIATGTVYFGGGVPTHIETDTNIRDIVTIPADWEEPWWYSTDQTRVILLPGGGFYPVYNNAVSVVCVQKSRTETEGRICIRVRDSMTQEAPLPSPASF